ncbi:MAG: adenylate/guanylate cyclase domain-containing protein [Pseudomonadota bacterium]|nr:adenylate/guanylate cyclase domain-containing protein [Pseudomonadota bacterium]
MAPSVSWSRLASSARLWSGLVLFTFAATHFINHAFGHWSIDAMTVVQDWRTAVTRSVPGTAVLLAAAVTHPLLGLFRFLRRRTMRPLEWLQLASGMLIPLWLARHLIGTRVTRELYGIEDGYDRVLSAIWPDSALNQSVLLGLVWLHGCIGIHQWLKVKPGYQVWRWPLAGLAVLIPALGLTGFIVASRIQELQQAIPPAPSPQQRADLEAIGDGAIAGYGLLLAVVVLLRLLLLVRDRFAHKIVVEYADGPRVSAPQGLTLLEISRLNGIPHASVCGGRARCSTCRVRVLDGLAAQPAALDLEARVLARVGAPANVRLACQLRPTSSIHVALLLPAATGAAGASDKYLWGVEREAVIVFCDLRGFTRLAEGRLSFDVVFLLNQYLSRMSEVIEDCGGYVDKFMGDGIMAIFGMEQPPRTAALGALAAGKAMGGVLDALNQSLKDEVPEALDIAIGIHAGPVILGRIGALRGIGAARRITALGDAVNTASRLESVGKEQAVQAVISKATMDAAGLAATAALQPRRIEVRGRKGSIEVFLVKRAVHIPAPEAPEAPS